MAQDAESGFSLLETVIALVILALSLATLFGAYNDGLKALQTGNRHASARILAQSLLAEVAEPANVGRRSGQGNGLDWQVIITPASGDLSTGGDRNPWRLLDVRVRVAWGTGRRIELRSLRLGAGR